MAAPANHPRTRRQQKENPGKRWAHYLARLASELQIQWEILSHKNNNSKNNGDDDEDGDDKDGDDDDDNVGVIEEATWHRPESEKGPEKDNAVTMIRILYMYKNTIMKPIL